MNQNTNLTINSLEENEAIIQKGLNTFYEVGNALTEIRDNKQYKASHSTFEQYCIERWGIKKSHAYNLINGSKTVNNLSTTVDVLPATEKQTAEISKAPPEDQAEVWHQAQEETGKEQPTAQEIKQVVETGHVHVAQNSGNNEWYTPQKFIESATRVMGSIDLDPASSALANKTVGAKKIYSKHDSGLDKEWYGNVWMNPPYAQPLMSQFADKISESVDNNLIDQAVVLVNNATETAWFQTMALRSAAICFPGKRIKFIDMDGNESGAPLQGQAILYFGPNSLSFMDEFLSHGLVFINEIH